MKTPKLLNENPMRYLTKLLGLRGSIVKNGNVYRLPTKNMTYKNFLILLNKKLDYLRPNKLIKDEEVGLDYITFSLNTTSPFNKVCVSKNTGIEVFIPTGNNNFKRK